MSSEFSYEEYVNDKEFLDSYNAYQAKYADQIRESDKILISLVRDCASQTRKDGGPVRLLDIGCSTGNFLMHVKRMLPAIELTGGDLAESSLALCRTNPELTGVRFRALDLLDLPVDSAYEVVVINAVLYMLTDEQYQQALASVARVLVPGGTLMAFDFFHPFEQDLSIMEVSKSHPNGLRLRFRPMKRVSEDLASAGFSDPVYRPFTLPIDLPRNQDPSELITYTVPAADGKRLPFRGTLFQPWCHLTARK